jgi:hypothetical protein
VRSDNEAMALNLDMVPAEESENLPSIDLIHKG